MILLDLLMTTYIAVISLTIIYFVGFLIEKKG